MPERLETPDLDDVICVASSLGIELSRSEALLYQRELAKNIEGMDRLIRAPLEERRPPLLYPEREPGNPPSPSEDPFNAWLWKCRIEGAPSGALAGKTVSFKDHIAVAGLPLTLGTRAMAEFRPDFDATIVTRALASGAIVTGKHHMNGPTSDWAWGVPGDYQRPLNPHAPGHWAGGSSSGSAVAVAARQVDISFGGDQGGSIRIPAAYCGTYGLKPTFGLVSHFGAAFGSDQSIDHVGPMALRATDLAAALDAVAGYDPLDPRQDRSVPAQVRSREGLANGVNGLRIAVLEEGLVGADPEVRDAVVAAVDVLVARGAKATRVSVPEHVSAFDVHLYGLDPEGNGAIYEVGFFGAFAQTYYPADWIEATYRLFREHVNEITPRRKLQMIVSRYARERYRGRLYAKAQNARPAIRAAFDRALDRADVLAMPTVIDVAPAYTEPESLLDAAFQPRPYVRNTKPYDFTGHPALSIPCGRSRGLPIGLQLVGRYYDEALLLRAAYAFEHSVDWDALTSVARDDLSVA